MTYPTPRTPTRGETIRDVLDARSATGAALGAVEFINRQDWTPAQLAAWGVVERNLCAALVALDGLADKLGIPLKTPDGEPISHDGGAPCGE